MPTTGPLVRPRPQCPVPLDLTRIVLPWLSVEPEAPAHPASASGGWTGSNTTSPMRSGRHFRRHGECVRIAVSRSLHSSATACCRYRGAAGTRWRTWFPPADRATPASRITRSPGGYDGGGSMSGPSCCVIERCLSPSRESQPNRTETGPARHRGEVLSASPRRWSSAGVLGAHGRAHLPVFSAPGVTI